MELKNLEEKTKRDFNNAISLMAIIPLLVFVYLIGGKVASLSALSGEVGYIMLTVMAIVLIGIFLGKQTLWRLVNQIFRMQGELLEKNRLIAITETVLTLGHEINNPLLAMQGNLSALEEELINNSFTREKVGKIRQHCERIMEVTSKLSSLAKPVSEKISGQQNIINLSDSK